MAFPLDDRVRLLAREAALLHERDQDAGRRVEAQPPVDVLAHAIRRTTSPWTSPHLREHVVEEDGGVREEHPLGAAVADVALVPERPGSRTRRPRSRAGGAPARRSARTGSGCACGHRGAALLPGRNGSISSPISVCWRFLTSVAKRSSDPPVIAIAAMTAACRSRWRSACSPGPRPARDRPGPPPRGRGQLAVRPDRPGDLAGRDVVEGARPGGRGRDRARTPSQPA